MCYKLALVMLLFSPVAFSSELDASTGQEDAIIGTYKELRKKCSVAQGDERVRCFSELNQLNAEYQLAKKALAGEVQSDTNLHIVSNVY